VDKQGNRAAERRSGIAASWTIGVEPVQTESEAEQARGEELSLCSVTVQAAAQIPAIFGLWRE
jgi:hypothetical protein